MLSLNKGNSYNTFHGIKLPDICVLTTPDTNVSIDYFWILIHIITLGHSNIHFKEAHF